MTEKASDSVLPLITQICRKPFTMIRMLIMPALLALCTIYPIDAGTDKRVSKPGRCLFPQKMTGNVTVNSRKMLPGTTAVEQHYNYWLDFAAREVLFEAKYQDITYIALYNKQKTYRISKGRCRVMDNSQTNFPSVDPQKASIISTTTSKGLLEFKNKNKLYMRVVKRNQTCDGPIWGDLLQLTNHRKLSAIYTVDSSKTGEVTRKLEEAKRKLAKMSCE